MIIISPARPANDNRRFDVTELTLMVFGPGLIVGLFVTALWLVGAW